MSFSGVARVHPPDVTGLFEQKIFVLDAKGRVSINCVKQNTAENAVKKGRAKWVGPNAVQHTDVFEGSEVTFDYKRYFPGDCIVIYGDTVTGEGAARTMELIEDHNNKYKRLRPNKERKKYIAALAARELKTVEYSAPESNLLDEVDLSIIGMIYILSENPMVSRYMITRIMSNMVRLLEYYLPMEALIPCLAAESINKRAVAAIKNKIKKGKEYRPVIVKTDDAHRFRSLRGRELIETATAVKEMGKSHIRCRIMGDSDLIVRTRMDALRSMGLIKTEYGAPVLTEMAHRIVRKTMGSRSDELDGVDKSKSLALQKEKPGYRPGAQIVHQCK